MNRDELIVVVGGTSESRAATETLLGEGCSVLWSQATDTPFSLQQHPRLRCRTGRLTAEEWQALLGETRAVGVVDAAHPHAVQLHQTLRIASMQAGIPLVRLRRATVDLDDWVVQVKSHAQAARLACEHGQRILVTVGTRHLSYYVAAIRKAHLALFVRALDGAESRGVLLALGCASEEVIFGRGPFSTKQNLQLLQQTHADVLVTKDSGKEGGLVEKLEAAKRFGCRVIVVARPEEPNDSVASVAELMERLRGLLSPVCTNRHPL